MARTNDRSEREPERDENSDEQHLEDVDDGCGCVEVWEHLAERRRSD